MKERSNTRNSILNQYGKVLPRAQRKLAIERAKPYQHPSTILREVSRPQPLSAVAKRSTTETVLTRAAFIKNVLTKIEEVWVGKDTTPEPSPQKSPREPELLVPSPNPPTLHVPEAFVGTPINMLSKRMSRLFDLVVQPSSQTSPEASHTQGTPPRSINSWAAPRSITKAPELSLLQTPQVVKRARALAASAPVFSSFTPQSILRSSLRPTPVGTPSASPGRSVTPPLRTKESRITFVEEAESPELPKSSVHWSNGLAADNDLSLKRPILPPEGGVEVWSDHSVEEEENEQAPSLEEKLKPEQKVESVPSCPVIELQTPEPKQVLPTLLPRPSLGQETGEVSIQSDTTLEFHDALSPGDLGRPRPEHQTLVETSVDEEVIVRVPRPAKPIQTTVLEPCAVTKAAEEQESGEDQEMVTEETSPEHASEVLPQQDVSKVTEDSEDQNKEEGLAQDLPEESVSVPLVEEPNAEPVVAEVLPHPEVVEELNEHDTMQEEPVLIKEVEPQPQEPASEPSIVAEEPISEPAEVTVRPGSESGPQQSLTEVSTVGTEPVSESAVVQEPEELESAPQEPEPEPSVIHEEAVSEPPAEELVNHEASAEDNQQDVTVEASDKVEHKAEAMETSDLDDYVERHLFGNDLSPPLSRSKGPSETWMSFNSESADGSKESGALAVDEVDAPGADTQKSVTSSEAATSESQSVVSLNDSDELSSAESEEDSGAEDDEEEEDEDSGSEVEIIEEVKGNGRQLQPAPALYLEELPPHEQFLQEQTTAVLSLVGTDAQLKMIDEEDGEGEVVMVGLEPADLDEEADGPVCLTELKPSTTLLVPLELAAEHQELLDGGTLHALAGDEPEEALPGGSNTFSLMLDAGDEEEEPAASEVDPNNQLLINQDTEHPEHMESQPVANPDVLCVEYADIPDELVEDVEDLPTAKAEPVVLGAPGVEQPDKPEAQPELIEEEPMQMVESDSAAGKESHSVLHEGRENGDVKDSAEEEDDEMAHLERKEPRRTVAHKQVVVEAKELTTAGKEVMPEAEDRVNNLSEGASPQDEHQEAVKPAEEHPEPPSTNEVLTDKPNKEETVQRSPARRSRKTVTFPLPVTESEKDLTDEELTESKVPSTPRRVTRSGKQFQDSEVPVTPRRSARKTELELLHGPEISSTKASKPASPSRTPQKATPRKGTRRTRNTDVGSDEEAQPTEESVISDSAVPQVRQSARKTRKASVDIPEPVPEEKAPEEPPEEPPKASASPSRVTRKSTRGLSLALESFQKDSEEDAVAPNQSVVTPPRSRRKTRAGTAEKANNVTFVVDEAQLQNVSRRLTRSQLWGHEEEPKKEEHLDVESENPLANALMERLQDEDAKEEGEVVTQIVRAKRRTTKSVAAPTVSENQNEGAEGSAEVLPPEAQEPTKKPNASVRRTRASKVPEPDTSPVKDSFTYTSSLQRTRGKKKDSAKTEISISEMVLSPPVTRTRRVASVAEEHPEENVPSNDPAVPAEEVKPKKKRTTRTKAAPEPVPPLEVDLLSPLASPAPPAGRTQKRAEEREEPVPRMNLRRKRVMEAIFPKPVTRRKKL